jgi:hypothetical protein
MTVLAANTNYIKVRSPFRPFFNKSAKSSASNFPVLAQFFSASFVFCGRNFGPLATLVSAARPGAVIQGHECFRKSFSSSDIQSGVGFSSDMTISVFKLKPYDIYSIF